MIKKLSAMFRHIGTYVKIRKKVTSLMLLLVSARDFRALYMHVENKFNITQMGQS
jgi:hypothetical protein